MKETHLIAGLGPDWKLRSSLPGIGGLSRLQHAAPDSQERLRLQDAPLLRHSQFQRQLVPRRSVTEKSFGPIERHRFQPNGLSKRLLLPCARRSMVLPKVSGDGEDGELACIWFAAGPGRSVEAEH